MNGKHQQRRLGIAAFALALLAMGAAPAKSETITVHGTADVYAAGTIYLDQIGFVAQQGGTLEFWYSYQWQPGDDVFTSPGYFTVMTYDAAHNVLDTLDLTPHLVGVAIRDNIQVNNTDHYGAQVQFIDPGSNLSVLMGPFLNDVDATVLPSAPADYLRLDAGWESTEFAIGIDVDHIDKHYTSLLATITTLDATITPDPDSDGDGVANENDQCPGTDSGDIVDAGGCSIDQLVPCAGPAAGGNWRNHGQYVSAVSRAAQQLLDAGLITQEQKDAMVAAAASSPCGH